MIKHYKEMKHDAYYITLQLDYSHYITITCKNVTNLHEQNYLHDFHISVQSTVLPYGK